MILFKLGYITLTFPANIITCHNAHGCILCSVLFAFKWNGMDFLAELIVQGISIAHVTDFGL